ncbi:hypothetical protein GCM10020001_031200 [Nonomuraea salmonea]
MWAEPLGIPRCAAKGERGLSGCGAGPGMCPPPPRRPPRLPVPPLPPAPDHHSVPPTDPIGPPPDNRTDRIGLSLGNRSGRTGPPPDNRTDRIGLSLGNRSGRTGPSSGGRVERYGRRPLTGSTEAAGPTLRMTGEGSIRERLRPTSPHAPDSRRGRGDRAVARGRRSA